MLLSGSLWRCRFCSNPFESEMIQELVQNIEDQLHNISENNPTVKSFETFIRKNAKDLHLKHYLNLIGKNCLQELNLWSFFQHSGILLSFCRGKQRLQEKHALKVSDFAKVTWYENPYCKRYNYSTKISSPQSIMSRLDPGYSQWMGSVLKKMKKAQLEMLKIDLQVKYLTYLWSALF